MLILALGSLLVAAAPRRDVDVVVSAGTPAEWLGDLPRPTPTRERTVPSVDEGRMTVVEQAPRVFATDVYRFAKITTVDLIGEIPWTVRTDTPTPSGGGTPTGGPGMLFKPPPLTDDVHWLCLALLLRRALHPAVVSEAEAEEYLVYVGEGAFQAATAAKSEPLAKDICKSVLAKVAQLPTPVPAPQKGKTPLEAMLHRLATEDLVTAYPFAFDGKFGRRLALLGDEMYEYPLEATRSRHPFLRRNAVLMLGRYPAPSALERLRELLEDPDPVVQTRALDALARRREKSAVPAVLKLYKKGGEWPSRLSLIRALGLLGDPQAAETIEAHLKKNQGDYDDVATCLIALSRLAPRGDAEHLKLLDRAEQLQFRDPSSTYGPVAPDPPGTRTAALKQLLLLARARAGHGPSADEVLSKCQPGGLRAARAIVDRMGLRTPLMAEWQTPVIYVLLETLRTLPKGDAALLQIASQRAEDLSVRVRALAELGRMNPPGLGPKLRPLVTLDEEFSVASVALHLLSTLAESDAKEAAKPIVDAYSPTLPGPRKALVAEAVKVLAAKRSLDPLRFAQILESEIIVHERGLARRPAPPRVDPQTGFGRGAPPISFESPVTFLEEILVAAGRSPDAVTRSLLRDVLSIQGMPGRAEAAVALGTARNAEDLPALVAALKDADPWVRFMAYRSLKFVLAKDAPCDWIYGTVDHRAAAVAKYAQWAKEFKP